jgi:hypothetical protein
MLEILFKAGPWTDPAAYHPEYSSITFFVDKLLITRTCDVRLAAARRHKVSAKRMRKTTKTLFEITSALSLSDIREN